MPFPVVKLAYIAIKQVSRPLARALKEKARTSPFLRTYILIKPAQGYHYLETNIKLNLLGLKKVQEVKPLSDEMALELGADMLGEIVVFSVGAFTLWLEYKRQAWNEKKRETSQFERISSLEEKVVNIDLLLEEQRTQIRELTRLTHSLHSPRKPNNSSTVAGGKLVITTANVDSLNTSSKKYDTILYSACVLAVLVIMYKTLDS